MRTSFAVLALVAGCSLAAARPKKNCKEQKKWKAAPSALLQKAFAARALSAAGRPDPTCKTGVASMKGQNPDPRVCCPAYCGECSDYPTCRNVNGQKSANACCASQVADLSCDKGKVAPNVCLKACSESVPPCMLKDDDFKMPDVTSAAEDCNEAVGEYMDTVESAVKGAKGGKKQWDKMEKDGKIFKL